MINFDEALDQLRTCGLVLDQIRPDGKIHRVKVEGDTGTKKSGWYVAHEMRMDSGAWALVGSYGNWKSGGDALKIQLTGGVLSDADRVAMEARYRDARAKADEDRQAMVAKAAAKAASMWAAAPDHGVCTYLARKGVKPFGVRFLKDWVLVPLRHSVDGDLVGLQIIEADGTKKFLTGTPKAGAFHLIGSVEGAEVLAVAEGYATAASIHMAMGWPVAVAFDCGNLLRVATTLRWRYPDVLMMILGDNDAHTQGNPGLTHAIEAAKAVGGHWCVPQFPEVAAK